MRAVLAGAALAAFVITPSLITPSLADYYIVQEPTTKRCTIVQERPASPGVGVVIGGVGFGVSLFLAAALLLANVKAAAIEAEGRALSRFEFGGPDFVEFPRQP